MVGRPVCDDLFQSLVQAMGAVHAAAMAKDPAACRTSETDLAMAMLAYTRAVQDEGLIPPFGWHDHALRVIRFYRDLTLG